MADKTVRDASGGKLEPLRPTDSFEVERPSVATEYYGEVGSLGIIVPVTQASHPFAPFDAIGHNGSAYVKADASSGVEIQCLGIVVEDLGTNDFSFACIGVHTFTTHGATLGQNFLSETAGAVTTTEPDPGNLVQSVLFAIDTDTVFINIGEAKT